MTTMIALRPNADHRPVAGLLSRLRSVTCGAVGMLALVLPGLAEGQTNRYATPGDTPLTREVRGMMMLDYSPIRLTTGGRFDLATIRYMQQTRRPWLSFGIGALAPMVEGDFSGFFGADFSLHAQRQIRGNWFVNGGLSLGVAAGGSSMSHARTFSGEGVYGRAYVGVGYRTRFGNFGLNFSRVTILNSPIDDNTVNFFVQRPLGFSVGRYGDAGRTMSASHPAMPEHQNIISLQFNNFRQINPTGSHLGDIGNAQAQFMHFLNRDVYAFLGADIGLTGVPLYNQAYGGLGRRFVLGRNLNLYTQLGVGSTGWATSTIDAGPGFFIYPRALLEYMMTERVGLTLSAGYMHAPLGTSRNWTVGLGMNYHLSHSERQPEGGVTGMDYTMRGIRMNVAARRTSEVWYNGRYSDPMNLVGLQIDYPISDHWYLTGQIAVATGPFRTYAGYGEVYAGVGWQSRTFASDRLQGYAQLMYGINPVGVSAQHDVGGLLFPAVGMYYHVNDRFSLYSQVGAVISTGQYLRGMTNSFRHTSVGFGVTYRFSLPVRS